MGGRRVQGRQDLYTIEDVIEKPTPTEAEQRLLVPGLRAGHYLCFFGMHVLGPALMEILARHVAEGQPKPSRWRRRWLSWQARSATWRWKGRGHATTWG